MKQEPAFNRRILTYSLVLTFM